MNNMLLNYLACTFSIQICNYLSDANASGCVVHIIAATGDINTKRYVSSYLNKVAN